MKWTWGDTYSGWSRSSAGSWWTCCRDGVHPAPVLLSPGSNILCSGCSNPSLKTGSGWDSVPQRPHSHTSYEADWQQGIIITWCFFFFLSSILKKCQSFSSALHTGGGRRWGSQMEGELHQNRGESDKSKHLGAIWSFGIFYFYSSYWSEKWNRSVLKPNRLHSVWRYRSAGESAAWCPTLGHGSKNENEI